MINKNILLVLFAHTPHVCFVLGLTRPLFQDTAKHILLRNHSVLLWSSSPSSLHSSWQWAWLLCHSWKSDLKRGALMTCVKLLAQLYQEPQNDTEQQLLQFKHCVRNPKSKFRPLFLPDLSNDNKHLQTMVRKMQHSTSTSSLVLFKAWCFPKGFWGQFSPWATDNKHPKVHNSVLILFSLSSPWQTPSEGRIWGLDLMKDWCFHDPGCKVQMYMWDTGWAQQWSPDTITWKTEVTHHEGHVTTFKSN